MSSNLNLIKKFIRNKNKDNENPQEIVQKRTLYSSN